MSRGLALPGDRTPLDRFLGSVFPASSFFGHVCNHQCRLGGPTIGDIGVTVQMSMVLSICPLVRILPAGIGRACHAFAQAPELLLTWIRAEKPQDACLQRRRR